MFVGNNVGVACEAFKSLDFFHNSAEPLAAVADGNFFNGKLSQRDRIDNVIAKEDGPEGPGSEFINLFKKPRVVPVHHETR